MSAQIENAGPAAFATGRRYADGEARADEETGRVRQMTQKFFRLPTHDLEDEHRENDPADDGFGRFVV